MKNYLGAYFFSLVLFAGCEEKGQYVPTEEEERLIRAYASILVFHERFGPATAPDSIQLYHHSLDSILLSYNLSREEFQRQFEDLVNSPERFKPLLQEISSILQKGVDRR